MKIQLNSNFIFVQKLIHSQLVWLEYFILFFYTFRNIILLCTLVLVLFMLC